MATNVVAVNVYQINQGPAIPLAQVSKIAFPTQGCLLKDVSASPTQLLSTGVRVYGEIQVTGAFSPSNNVSALFYTKETLAQLVTLFNA